MIHNGKERGKRFNPQWKCAVYQFGCGILKMVGPKKQYLWPKINIL